MRRPRRISVLLLLGLSAACGGDAVGPDPGGGPPPPGPPDPGLSACSQSTEVSLQPGGHVVVDPVANAGCVRFPEAPAGGAEYLYVALATNGRESQAGSSVGYEIRGAPAIAAGIAALPAADAAPALDPRLGKFGGPKTREAFHSLLRSRERMLSTTSPVPTLNRGVTAPGGAVIPPTVGHERTFKVCSTPQCTGFVDVTATARHVGPKGAIYLDNTLPAGAGYSLADIAAVGSLFDNYLYPIDTTSFGRESDLDANGVVVVLLTDQVNDLSGACNTLGSVILGYFFGNDLLPGQNGSNGGEVFYGLVPAPNDADCTISREYAIDLLAPTFIHEFQHMISFNQHVLVRGGFSEDTWLNEGLSHYAEELGGRQIPDVACNGDCFTQFAGADAQNAYEYLSGIESHFLVEPSPSSGTLEERGANWLFVRWLVDHFGADATGAAFTRALVATNKLGAENVAATTGVPFSTLTPEWQLANYLDNLAGFAPLNPRLQYESWNLRATYASFHEQAPGAFPLEYPVVPDSTLTGVFARTGVLRAGSGPHVRIVRPPQGGSVTFQLTDEARRAIGASPAVPRIGIARIR